MTTQTKNRSLAALSLTALLVLSGCSETNEVSEATDTDDPQTEEMSEEVEGPIADDTMQDEQWFKDECPAITADVRYADENNDPTGEIIDMAMIQGPVSAPRGLDDSVATVGMYNYDEFGDVMVFEAEITEDQVFCMKDVELDGPSSSGTEVIGPEPETGIGQMHLMTSPQHPDGIFVDASFWGREHPGVVVGHECQAWVIAEDFADLDNAEHIEEGVTANAMQGESGRANCD